MDASEYHTMYPYAAAGCSIKAVKDKPSLATDGHLDVALCLTTKFTTARGAYLQPLAHFRGFGERLALKLLRYCSHRRSAHRAATFALASMSSWPECLKTSKKSFYPVARIKNLTTIGSHFTSDSIGSGFVSSLHSIGTSEVSIVLGWSSCY